MRDHDPTAIIAKAMPEDPPPARFDLDRIVRDGHRARRRHRAALGGTAAAGVAVLAGALALAAGLKAAPDDGVGAAGGFDFDPAAAAYPYAGEWDPDDDTWFEEASEFQEAAAAEFAPLLDEHGDIWSGSDVALGRECTLVETSTDDVYRHEDCSALQAGLSFGSFQSPVSDGEGFMRGYRVAAGAAGDASSVFTAEAVLPGGWTPEPGPLGVEEFPRHLVDDEDAEFTSEELDDGRTLMVAERECGSDVLVVYPNASGLRVSWETGCEGEYPVDLEKLADAALAMPEFDFDTTGLAPVEELPEPTADWGEDEIWVEGLEQEEVEGEDWVVMAEADALATGEAVDQVLDERYPGAGVAEGSVTASASEEKAVTLHRYVMTGTLPFEAFEGDGDADVEIVYTMPGEWQAWSPGAESEGVPLLGCVGDLGECESGEEEGGRFVVVESDSELGVYRVTVVDEEGWAVDLSMTFEGEFELDIEEFIELAMAMPAPVY
jgi:hypothetical protein